MVEDGEQRVGHEVHQLIPTVHKLVVHDEMPLLVSSAIRVYPVEHPHIQI